jgi:undecaprenyl phosphate N,N'-diacetylbacillosamine 1-phosphate transferase
MYRLFGKRIFDLLLSLILLFITSPLSILCIISLVIQNKGNPFFFQERPGKLLVPFNIIKFKTMSDKRDEHGNLLPDVERMTSIGKWIRMLSLDELPQLINVIKGDMSLIGPRPLLFKYVPLYSTEQNRRHQVKPGITGWAQVNGRNSISWTKKFSYDIEYVDHISFLFDLKILLLTVKKILYREGINQSELRPMEPFNGYN